MTKDQTPYGFDDQLAHARLGEAFRGRFFARCFRIKPADSGEQRRGIDRHFHHMKKCIDFTVGYKIDGKAGRTGNASSNS
jgi:hypothetical protein